MRKVRVIKIDDNHCIYIFSKRIVYKERIRGELVTRFSGVDFSALLSSPVIDDKIKEKMKDIIAKLS